MVNFFLLKNVAPVSLPFPVGLGFHSASVVLSLLSRLQTAQSLCHVAIMLQSNKNRVGPSLVP